MAGGWLAMQWYSRRRVALMKAPEAPACQSLFQLLADVRNLCLQQPGQTMIDKVDLDPADAQFAGDFFGRPTAHRVKVKNLRMLRLYTLTNTGNCRFKDVLFPFSFPEGIELRRSRDALHG